MNNQAFFKILIIVIIFVFVGGAISVWQYLVKNETANWKTYINEEYGYEIRYPGDWKLTSWDPEFGWQTESGEVSLRDARLVKHVDAYHYAEIIINALDLEEKTTMSEMKEMVGEGIKSETGQIGGLEALNIIFKEESFERGSVTIYKKDGVWLLPMDNLFYMFGFDTEGEMGEFDNNLLIIDKILSTFRFLK